MTALADQRWTQRQISAAACLLDGARHGQQLVFLGSCMAESRHVLRLIALLEKNEPTPGARISLTNGAERYEHPSGGSVLFRTLNRTNLRGIGADRVLVDEARDLQHEDLRVLEAGGTSLELVDQL